MIHAFKRTYKGIFCYLFITLQCACTNSGENEHEIDNFQNINKLPRAKLGEYCWVKICQENQFCNKEFVCQCLPGCRIYNNSCVPIAGENEECRVSDDCCGKLVCINGICRKPVPSSEFVTLAKICLGITVTTIIIAVFSFVIKCLIRYEGYRGFRRDSDTGSLNSAYTFRRQVLNLGPSQQQIRDEKPPSYEECIQSNKRGFIAEAPPPYTIFNNLISSTVESPFTQNLNSSVVQSQNISSLNVQALPREINSNAN